MALSYGEISSITEKYFVPKLIDNIFTSNVLLERMRKGKMYQTYDGGEKILQPVMYAVTTSAGSYGPGETLNVNANDQISAAEFAMTTYYSNITITRQDELKNNGSAQIINLVKSKVQIAEMTLADTLGTDLYCLGTDTKKLIGLRLAVDSTGTYGGISRADYAWWAAQEDGSTTLLSIPAMQASFGDCTVGNDQPTLIVTTQDIYDDYHSLLQPQERYQDKDTASAGFTNLLFKGVPVVVDQHCPSGHMFFLNEKYISLYAHSKENFRFEPFIKTPNQNVSFAKIYWAGALVVSNCRMNGKMNAIA